MHLLGILFALACNPNDPGVEMPVQAEWAPLGHGLYSRPGGAIAFKHTGHHPRTGDVEYFQDTVEQHAGRHTPLSEVIDIDSFRALNHVFFRDKYRVYHNYQMAGGGRLDVYNADTLTFDVLDDCYAKDSKRVYYERKGAIAADPNTFVVLGGGPCFGRDKDAVYSWGEVIDPDSVTDPESRALLDRALGR